MSKTKIQEFLERNSKVITEIIEDSETYKIEDISILTKLNCEIAEVLIKIEGDCNRTVSTPKKGSGASKGKE